MELKITGMHDFKVKEGFSAETSGGIFTMIAAEKANDFMKESLEKYGQTTWQIGKVIKGNRNAKINKDVEVISVRESPFAY